MSLAPGTRLGPYEVTGSLGAGGMGEVYRARDIRLDRTVAIKVLPEHAAGDAQFRARFEREARAASALNHPNILSVFDVGRERDTEYLVTELVEGVTLRERIGERALPVRETVAIGAQIADGLATAHGTGLVHRDLKPENVMVTRDGRVKILDFGLAKPMENVLAEQPTQAAISVAGLFVGTAGYAAPEQVRGQLATAQSDLFSLGLMLYEMITGQPAFKRPTVVETLHAVLHDDVPELPPDAPHGLTQIIGHCLEKDPARRFQHAADVAFALRSFSSVSATAMPAMGEEPPAHRRWMSAALAAGAGLFLLGGGYFAARLTVPAGVDLSSLEMVPYAVEAADESSGAISPDGRSVAYVRSSGVLSEIVVKSDNAPSPAVLSRGHSIGSSAPLDLSWSPDGARIYFLEVRAFRSVAAVGGEPRDELENVSAAALAPDGKTFAAIRVGAARSEAQLYVGPRDQLKLYEPSPVAVAGCDPNFVRFSPDGSRILLWLACDANGIVIVPAPDGQGRGGPARRIWQNVTRAPQGITWLNDSRHVVFASTDVGTPGAVWLGDTVSGTLTHVTEALAPMMPLAAGPDNTIALTELNLDFSVVELPIAGGAPRTIIESTQYDGSPAWSSSGQEMAYVANRADGDEVRIRAHSDQSERRLLIPRDFPEQRPDSIRALSFSPDGQWLALTAYAVTPAVSGGVWIVPANGGTPRRVSQKDGMALRSAWAPDGRSIAIQQVKENRGELWVANIGQSTSRQVPLPADFRLADMEWSPNADVIAAFDSRPVDGRRSIVLIDASRGTLRRLVSLDWPALAWSRDGTQLYGVATGPKGSELQALDVKTGSVRTIANYDTHVNIAEDFGNSRRLTWAPDGRSLVTTQVTSRSNVWLMKGLQLPRRGPFDKLRTILSAAVSP